MSKEFLLLLGGVLSGAGACYVQFVENYEVETCGSCLGLSDEALRARMDEYARACPAGGCGASVCSAGASCESSGCGTEEASPTLADLVAMHLAGQVAPESVRAGDRDELTLAVLRTWTGAPTEPSLRAQTSPAS